MTKWSSRNGFALPVAVFALVVVGVLVTGGFYLTRQETRIGVASERATTAFYLAEKGANEVMSEWDASTFGALSFWESATVASTSAEGNYSVEVTRMTQRLYFLQATGTVTAGSGMLGDASRQMGVVARMNSATIEPKAALTTQGVLKYGGSSQINGLDQVSDGSAGSGSADMRPYCDPASLEDKPGILIDDTLNIDWTGNEDRIQDDMTGDPLYDEDPTLTPETLLDFGDMTWEDLVAMADIVLSTASPGDIGPSVTGGNCNYSVQTNWGAPLDPTSPCFNYFPIIYYGGGGRLQMSQGAGQGILLVDGDLKVTGKLEFYGPVYIRGLFETSGGGQAAHFFGGITATNVDLQGTDESSVLGNAVINFSSCAVTRAILGNANLTSVRPIEDRSWVDLSSLISG